MPDSTEAIDKSETINTQSSGGPAPAPGFLWVIWQAIRGTHISYDYTEGDIGHSIMLLAVPMVLEMLMESVFAVVDVFFVARLGPEAVAAVAVTESLMTLIYTLAIGLGIGAMALVARRIGGHDPEGASSAAAQAIAIGIIVSVVVGVAGAAFAPDLLAMMGASPAVVEKGAGFTRMMLAGNASVVLLFLFNSVFRGAGDAVIAMRVLWLANAINILLGPCLIFGLGPFPELGVTGAAVATTIGRGTGELYAFSRLLRPGARVRLTRRNLRIEPSVMLGLIRLSGNVWEWCQDLFTPEVERIPQDGTAFAGAGDERVLRGGCFHNWAVHSNVSKRYEIAHDYHDGCIGLRLVYSVDTLNAV